MAKPLRWNTPGFVWNSGVVWNGVEKPGKAPMNNVKAIVDFTGYVAGELAPVAQMIHDKMLAAATTFPSPPVTMVALQASIDDYLVKQTARESGAKSDTLAFNVARHELESDLGDNGGYVNTVAKGDAVTVDLSGYPSYNTTSVADYSPPAAPTDVRLRQGDMSGSLISRCKPARARSMNEIEICTADPNVEANWHDAGTFSGGKATITGLTPGSTVWVSIRTLGLKGVKGAWSDPAKIMVV